MLNPLSGVDETDLHILELLQANARTSLAAVGKAVGLSGPSVQARIQKLEDRGIIRAYRAVLDPDRMGLEIGAFVRVLTKPDADELNSFAAFVNAEPRILECHDLAGEDSFLIKVRCTSPACLSEFLQQLRSQPGVARTISSIVLSVVKETQVLPLNVPGARAGRDAPD